MTANRSSVFNGVVLMGGGGLSHSIPERKGIIISLGQPVERGSEQVYC